MKKSRDATLIDTDTVMIGAVRYMAMLAEKWRVDLVSVPPSSEGGSGFALEIAKRVGTRTGINCRVIFRPHSQGRRYQQAKKYVPIETDLIEPITGSRVMLIDDFVFTGYTMTRALKAVTDAGNECWGVVLC